MKTIKHENRQIKEAKPVLGDASLQVEIADAAHVKFIQEVGARIIGKTGELSGLYYSLVQGIRTQGIAPRLVSVELGLLGFHRVRISEINRIANAANDVFSSFEAKQIGFAKALEMARQASPTDVDKVPTRAFKQLLDDGAMTEADVEFIVEPDGGEGAQRSKNKSESQLLAEAVAKVFKLCRKTKTFQSGDGWQLTVSRAKSQKKVSANNGQKPE